MSAYSKTKVLVVEDDHLFLWSLVQFLKREGYEVSSATTAELAIEMAQEEPFDIVISDFHLPSLDGKQLIKKMRATHPGIKAVIISAYQQDETGGNDDESLLDAYLNKPIELRNLKELLEGLAEKSEVVEARHL